MLNHIYHELSPFKHQSPGSVFRCGRPGTGLLPASAVCDGYPDCPDGEDEARCPDLHQPRYFAPAASADLQSQYYYDYPAPVAVQVTRDICRRSESGYPPIIPDPRTPARGATRPCPPRSPRSVSPRPPAPPTAPSSGCSPWRAGNVATIINHCIVLYCIVSKI